MSSRKKIIFIAASPISLSKTEWDKEFMAIKTVLKQSDLKKRYEIDLIANATPKTITEHLEPQCWIIHFSGHGKEGGKTILETDIRGEFTPRPRDFLEVLSETGGVKCFFFNSCYSDELADIAIDYVDYVIGVKGRIGNASAIEFAEFFYRSFAKYETIPMAYKDAKRKLSLSKTKEINILFKCRISAIMDMVLQDKHEELQKLRQRGEHISHEIDLIEQDIDRLNAELKTGKETQFSLLSELIQSNPYPRGVSWFVDNQEQLAYQIGHKLLIMSVEDERNNFSRELSYLFELLEACLVMDDQPYTKADLKGLKTFSKKLFEQAFDELPSLVPEVYNTGDFIPFLKDNIKYMKGLL